MGKQEKSSKVADLSVLITDQMIVDAQEQLRYGMDYVRVSLGGEDNTSPAKRRDIQERVFNFAEAFRSVGYRVEIGADITGNQPTPTGYSNNTKYEITIKPKK